MPGIGRAGAVGEKRSILPASVATLTNTSGDADPRRWRILALLSTAELLGMALWFAGSAVSTSLAPRWEISTSTGAAWLMTAIQLGFVAGTAVAAVLNLADVIPAARYFAASAVLGAIANVVLLVAPNFETALATRFSTGVCLAGVYPPAMKMISTWFRSRRGLAIGTVVGALTIGKAAPYLVLATAPSASAATSLAPATAAHVLVATSIGAVIAAALVLVGYRDGPYPFESRPFSWRLVTDVVRARRWRLATSGYLGHMWELYAFWTWVPVFIAVSFAAEAGGRTAISTSHTAAVAFATIAIGGIGCVWGGLAADRKGREWLVILAMGVSGTCALLMPVVFGRESWLLITSLCIWSFFVIADSAQFSALVTESVPPHAVGTALTLQTSLGFFLTTFSIQLVGPIAGLLGWQWAFPVLAAGPALGIVAIQRFLQLRHATKADA
jgi:MFS family permease